MRSIYNFIVSQDKRYKNEIDVDGGNLIVNTEITERDAWFVNRIATVVSSPIAIQTGIVEGDEVIVHHNTFRRWYDIRGNERNGGGYISEGIYQVSPDQVYAYRRGSSWIPAEGYCFVEPLPDNDFWAVNAEQELVGKLVYGDNYLEERGVPEGSIVGFTPGSEYEFDVEGQRLFRVYSNQITLLYEPEEETRAET